MAKIKRKCSKCNRSGHNKATCKNKAKKKSKAKRGKTKRKSSIKRKCSKCNRSGHNKASCKNKKAKKKTKRKPKKTRRKSTTKSTGSRSLIGRGRGWKVFHYAGTTKKGNLSNKTWAIKMSGKKVWTHHGKTWGIKKSTPKTFSTAAAARKHYTGKLAEKRRKGYCLVGANRRRRKRR